MFWFVYFSFCFLSFHVLKYFSTCAMSISFLPKSVSREEAFYLEKCCPLLQEAGAVHVGGRSMCWTVDFTKRTDCEFTSNLCELLLPVVVVVVVASSMPLCTSQNVQNRGRNILLKDLKKIFRENLSWKYTKCLIYFVFMFLIDSNGKLFSNLQHSLCSSAHTLDPF